MKYSEKLTSYPILFLTICAALGSSTILLFNGSELVAVLLTLILLIIFILTFQVYVEIDNVSLRLTYGVGILKREIPLSSIVDSKISANDNFFAWLYHPFRDGCLVLKLREGRHAAIPVREQRRVAEILRIKDR